MSAAKPHFVYHEPTADEVYLYRLEMHGFREAMQDAYYGRHLKLLHEYLRAFLPQKDHSDELIDFLRRRMRRDLIKKQPSPEREVEDEVIAHARSLARLERRRHGKLTYGGIQRLIDDAWLDLTDQTDWLGPHDPERIDHKRILKVIRRGVKAKRRRR